MRPYSLLLLLLALLQTAASAQAPASKLISWKEIAAMPVPPAHQKINYGPDSLQFGELRIPEGKGKFPVVVVVHGGCWLSAYNLQYMSHLSNALTKAGYATWNIEFRRVGNPGGAWPGTLKDVAMATDYVRELAKKYPIDAKKVAVVGHSAGGHLALWLAARKQLPKTSLLYTRKPLKLTGAVALAGIPDLAQYSTETGSCNAAVEQLIGGSATQYPDRYAQASPQQMPPLHVPLRLVQGAQDPIVPVSQAENFAAIVNAKNGDAQVILLPEAGHFDLVVPNSPVWPQVLQSIEAVLPLSQ